MVVPLTALYPLVTVLPRGAVSSGTPPTGPAVGHPPLLGDSTFFNVQEDGSFRPPGCGWPWFPILLWGVAALLKDRDQERPGNGPPSGFSRPSSRSRGLSCCANRCGRCPPAGPGCVLLLGFAFCARQLCAVGRLRARANLGDHAARRTGPPGQHSARHGPARGTPLAARNCRNPPGLAAVLAVAWEPDPVPNPAAPRIPISNDTHHPIVGRKASSSATADT